jgi:hypothetical protein
MALRPPVNFGLGCCHRVRNHPRSPLLEITNALAYRLSIEPGDGTDGESLGSISLRLLQSEAVIRQLGFTSPLSISDMVVLPQLIPVLQLPDGYLDATVQETLIAAFLSCQPSIGS